MSEEKISKLPHLPLHPETKHITQEMADRIIDHLVEHYPERIEKIRDADQGHNNGYVISTYAEAMNPVINEMSKIMEVPKDNLGYIDLCFELQRRFRAAYDMPGPEVKGKPLAPTPKGPFPLKLANKPLYEETIRAGFTQAIVDRMVDQYYAEYPERCYVQAEAYRRELSAGYLGKFNSTYIYFLDLVRTLTEDEALRKEYKAPAIEAADRIRKTCEI